MFDVRQVWRWFIGAIHVLPRAASSAALPRQSAPPRVCTALSNLRGERCAARLRRHPSSVAASYRDATETGFKVVNPGSVAAVAARLPSPNPPVIGI